MAMTMEPALHCRKCGEDKPQADFYPKRPTMCRACYVAKSTEWKRLHPERERVSAKRYRKSAKGRAARNAYKKQWRAQNTVTERQHNNRCIDRITDAYVRNMLRHQHGIKAPTARQIKAHRNRIKILRSHRAFRLLSHGTILKN